MPVSNKVEINELSDSESLKINYQRKTLKEHILSLPDTYIGSTANEKTEQYIFNMEFEDEVDAEGNLPEKKFVKREFTYNPGLKSITEEILINAFDNKSRVDQRNQTLKGKKKLLPVTYIKINIDRSKNIIVIENNGEGIDIAEHPSEKKPNGEPYFIPELIFGELLTSGNYNKNEKKTTGGKNGYGAKLVGIYSTYFKIETVDRIRKLMFTQEFKNNMDIKTKPVIKKYTGEPFTRITFSPDLERFGLERLDKNYEAYIKKRAYDLFISSNTELKIYYNDKELEVNSYIDYYNMYLPDNYLLSEKESTDTLSIVNREENDELIKSKIIFYKNPNKRWTIAACPSPNLAFEQVSFVNGINTTRGGKHVEYIVSQITSKLAQLIKKKKKIDVKEQFIRENIMVFVNSIIENPDFDSQIKNTLTSPKGKFGSTCEIPEEFITKLYNTGIVDKVIQLNQLKINQSLKKTDGKKTGKLQIEKLIDAEWAGKKNAKETILILTEGDSAKTMAVTGRGVINNGSNVIGIFPLRGKPINVRKASDTDYQNNAEITHVKQIMGLKEGRKYNDTSELRYGKIMIMADQDLDGSHIKGLIMNFASRWPELLKIKGFLCSLLTPIVKVWKGKNKEKAINFYTLTEYNNWLEKNSNGRGYKHKYYKGLGTSTPQEAKQYFNDFKVINYVWDDNTESSIDLAFSEKRINDRKSWLSGFDPNNILDLTVKEISFTDFINKELIHFSNSDNIRSIPSLIDGLKPSQRKVLFSCFKRNLTTEIKVAQLAGYVSENAAYHHGEASLHGTIVNMAQTYVGSNNIQLLRPEGQFGSRLEGGKDSAQPRYIFTHLEPITQKIYNKLDEPLLKFQEDDGQLVEPVNYYPVIPMILVNGSDGIGTGWATRTPCFNPIDIIDNIKKIMNNQPIKSLNPWYRGFKGTIIRLTNKKWLSRGVYKQTGENTIEITELPIGTWSSDYKTFLDKLIVNNTIVVNSKKDKGKKGKKTTIPKNHKYYLKDCHEYCSDTSVRFVLKFLDGELSELLNGIDSNGLTKFEKVFKLTSAISCERTLNYYNEQCKLLNFQDIEGILEYFVKIRLEKYQERKDYMVINILRNLKVISLRVRFILDIINGKLEIKNVPKKKVIEQMEKLQYPYVFNKKNTNTNKVERQVLDKDQYSKLSSIDKENCNYDFLLEMSLYTLTQEKVEELKKEKDQLETELETLKSKTKNDLWIEDLDDLRSEYDKFMKEYYKENNFDSQSFAKNDKKKKKTDMSSFSKKKKNVKKISKTTSQA